jgi:hypothetical protein
MMNWERMWMEAAVGYVNVLSRYTYLERPMKTRNLKISSRRTRNLISYLLNAKQECQPLDPDDRFYFIKTLVQISPSVDFTLSQLSPVPNITHCYFKLHFICFKVLWGFRTSALCECMISSCWALRSISSRNLLKLAHFYTSEPSMNVLHCNIVWWQ